MKNKYISSVVIIACFAALAFVKPAGVNSTALMNYETVICSTSDVNNSHQAILCETDFNFSVATIKGSSPDNVKTYEKHFKYKLPVKENLRIEYSVENYIFYTESLTDYHNDLSKLRRLNI